MELAKNPSPLAAYESHELLELMGMKEDPVAAEQAFNEFYKRFQEDIYRAVFLICSGFTANHHEMSRIILNNTFINAYTYAASFKTDEKSGPEAVQKKITGWLLKIARTEIKHMFSKKVNREEEHEAYKIMLHNAKQPIKKDDYDASITKRAFSQIPKDRDREIFYSYWVNFEESSNGNTKKMRDMYIGLAERFNTTEQNVRQIISRSKKLVAQYLDQHYKK
jgi:DNA-directed RNA polymerase specialized sigma24 family protein